MPRRPVLMLITQIIKIIVQTTVTITVESSSVGVTVMVVLGVMVTVSPVAKVDRGDRKAIKRTNRPRLAAWRR
jgi:hypothetical protein